MSALHIIVFACVVVYVSGPVVVVVEQKEEKRKSPADCDGMKSLFRIASFSLTVNSESEVTHTIVE